MRTLLVTGAAGHLGRQVVERLLGTGDRVIAGTRDPNKLADLAAKGVEIRRVDLDDPATLATAFAGVDRLLLISTDALDRPGRRLEQHLNGIAAAKAANVKHLVYTSLISASAASACLLAPDHVGTEVALLQSGVPFTILRMSMYVENLLGTLPGAVASGALYSAAGSGKIAYLSRTDCARAAAAALAATTTASRTLDITGARALGIDQVAAIAGKLAGKPIAVVQVPVAGLIAGMEAHGLPAPVAAVYASLDAATAAGEFDVVSGALAELTGEPARDFASVLADYRGAFGG